MKHIYLDQKMGFGKHAKKTFKQVVDADYDYVMFCLKELDFLRFDAAARTYMIQQAAVAEKQEQEHKIEQAMTLALVCIRSLDDIALARKMINKMSRDMKKINPFDGLLPEVEI